MPVGFPASESGADLRLLKHLFTEQEARIALKLSMLPEPLARIHKRVKKGGMALSIEELGQILDRMVKKGLIMRGRSSESVGPEKAYSTAQFAIGIFEFQVDQLTKEVAIEADKYSEETFYKEFHKRDAPTQIRTIPIEKSLTPEHHVSSYDDVRALVEKTEGPFSIMNCVCKQAGDLLDRNCQQTDIRETCLTLNHTAQHHIDIGVGREISKSEVFELLDMFEKEGLVVQPENAQSPAFFCLCCGCCCGVLRTLKQFPRPAEFCTSNYFAEVDSGVCIGCKKCLKRCQMEALSVENKLAKVDLDRCIGCGLCVSSCPSDAILLKKKPEEAVPPKNSSEMYRKILKQKVGTAGLLKIAGKRIFGMQI